jgi:hypothetical protein
MKNKIILLVSFFTVVFLFGSCLKDDVGEYWKDDLAGKMYATVAKATLQQLALQPVAGDVKYEFLINIATDALPTEDIVVTLKIDPAAVTQYNTDFKKSYKPYPNAEILTKTVTILKGTRNIMAQAKVWDAQTLDACDNFIAAISIESAKTASGKDITIAGNMKTYLLALPIANPYSGNYHAVGYRNHPTAGMQPFDYASQELSTFDCKTVHKGQVGNYGGYTLNIEITKEIIVVGGKNMNKVVLDIPEVPGDWDIYATDPDGKTMNYYDPSTKTFELYYFYNKAAPRIIRETLTRN